MKGNHHAPIIGQAPQSYGFDNNVCPACLQWAYSTKINNLGHCPECLHEYSTRLIDGVVVLTWAPLPDKPKPVQPTLL